MVNHQLNARLYARVGSGHQQLLSWSHNVLDCVQIISDQHREQGYTSVSVQKTLQECKAYPRRRSNLAPQARLYTDNLFRSGCQQCACFRQRPVPCPRAPMSCETRQGHLVRNNVAQTCRYETLGAHLQKGQREQDEQDLVHNHTFTIASTALRIVCEGKTVGTSLSI